MQLLCLLFWKVKMEDVKRCVVNVTVWLLSIFHLSISTMHDVYLAWLVTLGCKLLFTMHCGILWVSYIDHTKWQTLYNPLYSEQWVILSTAKVIFKVVCSLPIPLTWCVSDLECGCRHIWCPSRAGLSLLAGTLWWWCHPYCQWYAGDQSCQKASALPLEMTAEMSVT